MPREVLGLDVGGANLKAAHTNGAARSRPFALWKAPGELAGRLRALIAEMPAHDLIAVTMTGELCDCFASKAEGVRAILRAVEEAAGPTLVWAWSKLDRFLTIDVAQIDTRPVGAANWLALARNVARGFAHPGPALLIDAGSTTTDLVYLGGGQPRPRGRSDPERLACGELVYTGVRRTPVCAVLGLEVAAEFFATMLDVYLLLGGVPENEHDCDTADGRPATRPHAHARLARLRCADVDEFPDEDARDLAKTALARQVQFVSWAVDSVLRDRQPFPHVILSGSGEVLGRAVHEAHPLLRRGRVTSLSEHLGPELSAAACAYAVAVLAAEDAE